MQEGSFFSIHERTELALTCVDSIQRGRVVTCLLSSRRNGGFSCNNLDGKYTFCLVILISRSYERGYSVYGA